MNTGISWIELFGTTQEKMRKPGLSRENQDVWDPYSKCTRNTILCTMSIARHLETDWLTNLDIYQTNLYMLSSPPLPAHHSLPQVHQQCTVKTPSLLSSLHLISLYFVEIQYDYIHDRHSKISTSEATNSNINHVGIVLVVCHKLI